MTVHAATQTTSEHLPPVVNNITLDHPWTWLAKGWQDLKAAPKFSLAYGAVFFFISSLLTAGLFYESLFFIIPPLTAGFFLVAPMLGIGLYQISKTLEQGKTVEYCQALIAWRKNETQLAAMSLVLLMVVLVWMLAALLIFALLYSNPVPTWENFVPVVFLSGDNWAFVMIGTIVGGLIAAFTFAISVVTVPMLMDRQVNVVTAMRTSLETVRRNWRAMALWAGLIIMFVGIGIATYFVGLIVTMPLVGHATWHAYRDLVPEA